MVVASLFVTYLLLINQATFLFDEKCYISMLSVINPWTNFPELLTTDIYFRASVNAL